MPPETSLIMVTHKNKRDIFAKCLAAFADICDSLDLIIAYDRRSCNDAFDERVIPNADKWANIVIVDLQPSRLKQQAMSIELCASLARTKLLWIQDDDTFFQNEGDCSKFLAMSQKAISDGCVACAAAKIIRRTENGEIIMAGSMCGNYAWLFTGQQKIIVRDALLRAGTMWREFKHYGWWDVAVGCKLAECGPVASLPFTSIMIEHKRYKQKAFNAKNHALMSNACKCKPPTIFGTI